MSINIRLQKVDLFINEFIKINRFPLSFCFQLTNEKIDLLSLRSQIELKSKFAEITKLN